MMGPGSKQPFEPPAHCLWRNAGITRKRYPVAVTQVIHSSCNRVAHGLCGSGPSALWDICWQWWEFQDFLDSHQTPPVARTLKTVFLVFEGWFLSHCKVSFPLCVDTESIKKASSVARAWSMCQIIAEILGIFKVYRRWSR